MELILFILFCYGASNIMVFGSIFTGWREFTNKISPNFLGDLFTCMICLPWWWGLLTSIFVYSPSTEFFNVEWQVLAIFVDATLASGSVWILHTIQEHFE